MKKVLEWLDVHSQWKNLIGILVVVALFVAFGFRADRAGVRIAIEGDDFVIRYADQFETRFSKRNVQSVNLAEDLDYGSAVDAVSEEKYLVGAWENGEYGRYDLAVKKSVDACIVVRTAEGVTVYNYDNKKQTEAAYDALIEWIEAE